MFSCPYKSGFSKTMYAFLGLALTSKLTWKQRYHCFFPCSCDFTLIILVRIRSRAAGTHDHFYLLEHEMDLPKCLLSIWQGSSRSSDNYVLQVHCILPTSEIPIMCSPFGQVMWCHLFLLFNLTQMLPWHPWLQPQRLPQSVSGALLTTTSCRPNHSSTHSPIQSPFTHMTSSNSQSKQVGLIIPLFIHKAPTRVWISI